MVVNVLAPAVSLVMIRMKRILDKGGVPEKVTERESKVSQEGSGFPFVRLALKDNVLFPSSSKKVLSGMA